MGLIRAVAVMSILDTETVSNIYLTILWKPRRGFQKHVEFP